jgi:translation initiation factor 2 subunit 3
VQNKVVNIDMLLDAIQTAIPTPERNPNTEPIFYVARTFDVNKPGSSPNKLLGGILGGSVIKGKFSMSEMTIEIRPGRIVEEQNKLIAKPIFTTKITGMKTGGTSVDELHPGGSSAILTSLDPSIAKGDQLTGCIVGYPG